MKNFKKLVSLVMCILLTVNICSTAAEATSQEHRTGGSILAELHATVLTQAEAEGAERKQIESVLISIYNEVENSMKTQCTNSTASTYDEYAPYYAGAYIDGNKLIVCVTTEAAIPEKSDSSVLYRVVDNSYNELVNIKASTLAAYEEYFQLYTGSGTDEENLLLSLSSFAIDEELNKIVVDVVDLDNSKVETFCNLFGDNDVFAFENAYGQLEEYTIYKPGVALYICTKRNGTDISRGRLSMGYRAKRVVEGLATLYGFVTAAHGCMDSIDHSVYSDFNCTEKIGTIYIHRYEGSVDTAFVVKDSGVDIGTTTYYSDSLGSTDGGDRIIEGKYMTVVPKNTTVYKVGSSTYRTSGKVTSTNADAKVGSDTFTNLTQTDLVAESGDSGGLVYVYFENEYNPAGIVACGVKGFFLYKTCYVKATEVASNMYVYPY